MGLLLIGIIPVLYAQFHSPNPYFVNNAYCKIRIYLNHVTAMSCRWLLAMACIDRCLTCSMHARFRHVFTVKASRQIVAGLILVWMIIPIHTLIFGNIIPPGNIACTISNIDVVIYHGLYTLIFGGLLPPIVMSICTFSIWLSLKQKHERQTKTSVTQDQRKNVQRDQQVIIILLCQVALFGVSTLPFMCNSFYSNLTRSIPNKPADRVAIESFIGSITESFVYIFPASTFYCNTLVSRTFRQELYLMFRWLRPGSQRINPNSQTRSQIPSRDGFPASHMNTTLRTSTV